MSKPKYEIVIASVADRDKVVAEIWCDSHQFAEVRQEGEDMIVLVYPRPGVPVWEFGYRDLLQLLREAKERLIGPDEADDAGVPVSG